MHALLSPSGLAKQRYPGLLLCLNLFDLKQSCHHSPPFAQWQVDQALGSSRSENDSTLASPTSSASFESEHSQKEDCALKWGQKWTCRDAVRCWRSFVLRKQDRQSVLRYTETLHNLNLVRRTMGIWLTSAQTPDTENVACQTTPTRTPSTSAASNTQSPLISKESDRLAADSVTSAGGMPSTFVSSPHAKAKMVIKRSIRLVQAGVKARGRSEYKVIAGPRALGDGRPTDPRGGSCERRNAPSGALDHEGRCSEDIQRPLRTRRLPTLPHFAGKVRPLKSLPLEILGVGGAGVTAHGSAVSAGGTRSGERQRSWAAEETVKRNKRRQEREKLLSKVEAMEMKLLREISALDAQVRASLT